MNQFSRVITTCIAISIGVAAFGLDGVVLAENEKPVRVTPTKSFSTLQFEFQVFLAELEKPLKALGRQYTARLQKVESGLIEDGDAVAAEVLRKEILSYESGQVVIPPTLAEAVRLRGIYERERLPLIRVRNQKCGPLFASYRDSLLALQSALASQGKTDEAEKIEAELKRLEQKYLRLMAAENPGNSRVKLTSR